MTVSFRIGRYLLALLWHWSIPFSLGGVFASVLALQGVSEGVDLLDQALDASISRVADACALGTDPPERRSPPVSGAGLPVAGTGGETG
ncbi:hypothetical protein [Pseudomonas zhanjiangensis]|uniref:Uncharacterized protein n=1 Tax=Pseudomonas zhanjiangensis TaxID=3239015 RepID=A0ABV3YQW7_9PSED